MAEATHQVGACLSDGSFELADAQTLRVVVEAEPGSGPLSSRRATQGSAAAASGRSSSTSSYSRITSGSSRPAPRAPLGS